jgi:mannosyltransferase
MSEINQQTPELVVTNFHRRYTGVSATADAVVSKQKADYRLCLVGDALPSGPEPISFRQAVSLCRTPPQDRPFSIWHVRRNLEMAAAIFARDVLKLPIRIVFTSAAQRLHSAVPRRLIARMDAVVATTDKAAAFVPQLAAVVPHGVDTDRFTPAADREAAWANLGYGGKYGIGIVGRVRPEKGTDLFVDAMLRVLPQRPEYTAIIIGRAMPADAAFEQALREKITAAGLEGRIRFIGEQPPSRIPEIVRALSLLVAPARYEGYGMTPLEAMASGVAVVATKVGGYEEMIARGETGELVEIGDLDGIAKSVLEITMDANKLKRLGEQGRHRSVASFSLHGEIEGIARIYESLWREAGTEIIHDQKSQASAVQATNSRRVA